VELDRSAAYAVLGDDDRRISRHAELSWWVADDALFPEGVDDGLRGRLL